MTAPVEFDIRGEVADTIEAHGEYLAAMARSWIANGDEHHGQMLGRFVLAAQWWLAGMPQPTETT